MDDQQEIKLSIEEAYLAMYVFLDNYYNRYKVPPDELANILSEMQLLDDGIPADPAVKQDWLDAVTEALNGDARQKAAFRLRDDCSGRSLTSSIQKVLNWRKIIKHNR